MELRVARPARLIDSARAAASSMEGQSHVVMMMKLLLIFEILAPCATADEYLPSLSARDPLPSPPPRLDRDLTVSLSVSTYVHAPFLPSSALPCSALLCVSLVP